MTKNTTTAKTFSPVTEATRAHRRADLFTYPTDTPQIARLIRSALRRRRAVRRLLEQDAILYHAGRNSKAHSKAIDRLLREKDDLCNTIALLRLAERMYTV